MAEFKNQKLPFLFEVWHEGNSEPLDSYIVPYNPETYRDSEVPRVAVTQTRGGSHRDHSGLGLPKITFSGTTGYYGTHAGGKAKHANGHTKDGVELALEFKEFLLRFYRDINTRFKEEADKHSLRFYNFTDEVYLEVELDKFDLMRAIAHRNIYKYDIALTGVRRLDESPESRNDLKDLFYPPDLTTNVADLGTWETLLEAYTSISTTISDTINYVDDLESKLAIVNTAVLAFRNGISSLIEAPFGLVTDAAKTVNIILESVESLTDLPHEFKDLMKDTKRKVTQLESNRDRFLNPLQSTAPDETPRETGYEIVTKDLPASSAVTESGALGMDIPEITLIDPDMENSSDIAQSTESVRGNDTIQTIAHRVLGDATQWQRIAFLNSLEAPFIVNIGSFEQVTEILASSTLDLIASVGDNVVQGDLDISAGEAVVFWVNDQIVEVRIVDSVMEGVGGREIYLQNPMENEIPVTSIITAHDRKKDVILRGEKIKIPATTTGANDFGLLVDGDIEEKLFLTDERVDKNGLPVVTGTGEQEVVSGMTNFEMQLKHRLDTMRGELAQIGHPNYGSLLPTFVGRISDDIWFERAKLEAKMTILEDPRTDRVESLTFRVEGTAMYIEGDVKPINQSSSERISLALGR